MSKDKFDRAIDSLRRSQTKLEALLVRLKEQRKQIRTDAAAIKRFSRKVEASSKIIGGGRGGGG